VSFIHKSKKFLLLVPEERYVKAWDFSPRKASKTEFESRSDDIHDVRYVYAWHMSSLRDSRMNCQIYLGLKSQAIAYHRSAVTEIKLVYKQQASRRVN